MKNSIRPLNKAQASRGIDEPQAKTGRGKNPTEIVGTPQEIATLGSLR